MSELLNTATYDAGIYAPVPDERHDTDLTVVGRIPAELHGVFAQNAPNPAYPLPGFGHWFDGDGMVHAVQIEDGRASYRNRYVATEGLAADRAAGAARQGGILMPFDPTSDTPDKDTANTDLVWHNGRLWALWYLGGQPYGLDPVTLETQALGEWGGPAAAHPKVCPETGELMFIDFSLYRQPWLSYGVLSREGKLVHRQAVDIPQPTFMHDIGITRNHTIFLDLPMTWDQDKVKVGKRRIRFQPETPSRFGIVPRHGGPVRWFETDACYAYHSINAWEETDADGTVVHLTACRIEDPIPTTPHETEPEIPRLTFLRLHPLLHKWTFHLGTGAVTSTRLDDVPTEFPRMNDAFLGRKSRYSYNPRIAPLPTLAFDGLVKYDAEGGSRAHSFGGQLGGEAVFVPRPGATVEDDGWLVGFTHDRTNNASELRIVDASTMDAEPVARISLPRRVPFGFHAAWVPGAEIGSPA